MVLIYLSEINLIISIFSSGIIYALTLYFFKACDGDDKLIFPYCFQVQ